MFVFLDLGYLTQDDDFQFHPFAWKFHNDMIFNSWLIPHSVNVPHFPHPLFSWGTLDRFQVLAITNITYAMNIVEQVFLWYDCAFFGYIPKGSTMFLEVDQFLVLWETVTLIYKIAIHVCTPTNSEEMFFLLHILLSMNCHLRFLPFWQV